MAKIGLNWLYLALETPDWSISADQDWTPNRQGFCFELAARWALGRPLGQPLGSKNTIFSPKKGHFGQSGPENGPPSGPTGTYKKTEGIQSYLRTWGRYDLIESGLSEAKKMSYVGVA